MFVTIFYLVFCVVALFSLIFCVQEEGPKTGIKTWIAGVLLFGLVSHLIGALIFVLCLGGFGEDEVLATYRKDIITIPGKDGDCFIFSSTDDNQPKMLFMNKTEEGSITRGEERLSNLRFFNSKDETTSYIEWDEVRKFPPGWLAPRSFSFSVTTLKRVFLPKGTKIFMESDVSHEPVVEKVNKR